MLHGIFPMEVVLGFAYPHMASEILPGTGFLKFGFLCFGLRLSASHHVEQRSRIVVLKMVLLPKEGETFLWDSDR